MHDTGYKMHDSRFTHPVIPYPLIKSEGMLDMEPKMQQIPTGVYPVLDTGQE